jgi:DNA-binding CsgD family transcriptional regulator
MGDPVNFYSVCLDGILSDWLATLREFAVEAVVVLGHDRQVVCVHPPMAADTASALAASTDFSGAWRESDAPLVAWQHLTRGAASHDTGWRGLARAHGFQSMVRVEFPLPARRSFECFMFSPRELIDRAEAALLVWSTLSVWPLVRRSIADERSALSPRERQCLALAFDGYTARESALRLSCTERTVNYHLANAMAKLKVENKLAAIQRASWIGAI